MLGLVNGERRRVIFYFVPESSCGGGELLLQSEQERHDLEKSRDFGNRVAALLTGPS